MHPTMLLNRLNYTYPVSKLETGHCYGNRHTYACLDSKTDVLSDAGSVRHGLRESTDQRYYLVGWEVAVAAADGTPLTPIATTLAPAYQETTLQHAGLAVRKRFFVPFENNWLRSAHFVLEAEADGGALQVRSRALFPAGSHVEPAEFRGHACLAVRLPEGGSGLLWSSEQPTRYEMDVIDDGRVAVRAVYDWRTSQGEYFLSYAYQPVADTPPWGALFDPHNLRLSPAASHRDRVRTMLAETQTALARYLRTARLTAPDALLERAVDWAKINQLRDQQEYRLGMGFSNNPPSDTVVARDSVWYLAGSSYYAQDWSRRLWDLWLRYGVEPNGKFIEYFLPSHEPLFRDDYGLNINDGTPLFMIAAHHYYALTGERDFLDAVYPVLLRAADLILAQRRVGEHNRFGLVWCTSRETFVRGLCGWRNCIRDYTLSGAVTEINALCCHALALTAELARARGDGPNAERLEQEATDLRRAIETHLRCSTPGNPFYYLNINPDGEPVADLTADLVFPVLYGIADRPTAQAVLQELFSERFWVVTPEGGGGLRTVSAAEAGYRPAADPGNYGLLGGVWPNLALWASRAAAAQGLPDRALQALRATFLLTQPSDPARYHVVPGQLPEYCNGDDLVQRGQPRSTFLFGILVWAALESFLGLTLHPFTLEVEPSLPTGWDWVAIADSPYRGYPLSLLADGTTQTLYTTVPVRSSWRQVVAPATLQQPYTFESSAPAFWLVAPSGEGGRELLAASSEAVSGRLLERATGHVAATVSVPAGGLARVEVAV